MKSLAIFTLCAAALLRGMPASGAAEKAPHPPKAPFTDIRRVIVVFKTHFDIGFTDMASEVVQKYRTNFTDRALQILDQNRGLPPDQQFAWTLPGWPLHKMLEDWPGQTPERKNQIERAVREGRFNLHALPFTLHTELLELDDLVHGLGYASRLSRRFGLPLPRDAKMTDVPEHARVLPTLLRRAGVEFLHIGCNQASRSPDLPDLFWWEGPDGSRLLTFYSGSYDSGLAPPPGWPCRTWLALIMTGDNQGPPLPGQVRSILEKARRQFPNASVRIGRLADFADAVIAEKAVLPVVRADTPDSWIHGPMSDPAGMILARTIRPTIPVYETLALQAKNWGVAVSDPATTLTVARESSLLYGEHTWGASHGWLNSRFDYGEEFLRQRARGRYTRTEASWEEHSGYIRTTARLVQPLLRGQLAALACQAGPPGPRNRWAGRTPMSLSG